MPFLPLVKGARGLYLRKPPDARAEAKTDALPKYQNLINNAIPSYLFAILPPLPNYSDEAGTN
jgi:hypothetical protein